MDLLSSRPLREGSRGGRSEFSWEAVKNDKDRENYLGHSLMAPVGRWQQGKDLTWYAKDNKSQAADEERARRVEELRKIKEAEEDEMARALGQPIRIRNREPAQKVIQEELKRVVGGVEDHERVDVKGDGLGTAGGFGGRSGRGWEKAEGQGFQPGRERDLWTRERRPPRADLRDAIRDRKEASERGDRRAERGHRDPSRERDRHHSRRDRSRSRDRSGRPRHDDSRRGSQRNRDERDSSPTRKKRSFTRSRSPENRRDRSGHHQKEAGGSRPERGNNKRRDRSRDYGRRQWAAGSVGNPS
ncbi:kinase phosphorylation protein-domain-containing protein [Tirmania nivea]|nr:kinase phosphorylation protein-domain-containing protein [Tirmania nivea]